MVGIVYSRMRIPEKVALEKNNINEKMKRESKYLLILMGIIIVIFKIIFYREGLLILAWAVISFFLTFTIPGFILCYLWHEDLDFTERFIVGNMIGLMTIGIISYNISIYTGIHIKHISIIAPIITASIFGMIIYVKKIKGKNSVKDNISNS